MTNRLLKPNEIADIRNNLRDFEGIEDKVKYDEHGKETQIVIISKKYSSISEEELQSIEKYNLKLTSCWYSYGTFDMFFKRADYETLGIER